MNLRHRGRHHRRDLGRQQLHADFNTVYLGMLEPAHDTGAPASDRIDPLHTDYVADPNGRRHVDDAARKRQALRADVPDLPAVDAIQRTRGRRGSATSAT